MRNWYKEVKRMSLAKGLGAMWQNPERKLDEMSEKELAANGILLAALWACMSTNLERREFERELSDDKEHAMSLLYVMAHRAATSSAHTLEQGSG